MRTTAITSIEEPTTKGNEKKKGEGRRCGGALKNQSNLRDGEERACKSHTQRGVGGKDKKGVGEIIRKTEDSRFCEKRAQERGA